MKKQTTAKSSKVTMGHASYALECLLEQERNAFTLVAAARDLSQQEDPYSITTQLLDMAFEAMSSLKHNAVLGDYFGVNIHAGYEGEDHDGA